MKPGILAIVVAVGLITVGLGKPPARPVPAPSSPGLLARSTSAPAGGAPLQPLYAAVDSHPGTGTVSNLNGFLEPGETVQISPFWTNVSGVPQTFAGAATNLTGPPGPTYTIDDSAAEYGTLATGGTTDCDTATGNCYVLTVAGSRPFVHWDVTF